MSIEPYVYPPREPEEVERQLDESTYSGCARKAIEEFGLRRVELVLAATIQSRSRDRRFSQQVREWAGARAISSDGQSWEYTLNAHSVVVDGFARQYLRTVEEMAREAMAKGKQEPSFPEITL